MILLAKIVAKIYNILMETMEIEKETMQINFDFLEPEIVTHEWVAKETLVVILRQKNDNVEICGKKMVDWVKLSTSGCKQKELENVEEVFLFEKLAPIVENFEYVAVFYGDTPLLKKSTFFDVMQYFSSNHMNVMKLPRGYVFRSEYLQTAKIMLSSSLNIFDEEDFLKISTAKEISHAFAVLQKRIIEYHKENGVIFFGENTIFIDADVEIESGVIVYPNNVISGQSYIGKDCIIESGNYIFDTIICDDVFVCQSYLEKSKVERGKVVGPFEKIINKKV